MQQIVLETEDVQWLLTVEYEVNSVASTSYYGSEVVTESGHYIEDITVISVDGLILLDRQEPRNNVMVDLAKCEELDRLLRQARKVASEQGQQVLKQLSTGVVLAGI